MRRFLLACVLLVLLTPSVHAWTLGEGVEISQPPVTVIIGHDIEVATDAYFIGNAFYIAPFGFEFVFTNPHTWTLENWSAPLNVTFVGNATEDGSIRFTNFQGIYQVTGLFGYPSFLISGPSFELVIPQMTTNFTVRLASLSGSSPIQLHMSAAWSPLNDSVFAVATLLDNFGNAWSSPGMTSTLLRPDGSVHSTIAMTETVVNGVYNANHAVAGDEPNGTWTVTAQLGTTVASYAIIKQPSPITEGSTVDIDFTNNAGIAALLWAALGLVLLGARLYLPILAVALELLNISFRSADQPQLWGWHFSLLLCLGLAIIHIGYRLLTEAIANRGNSARGERQ